MRIMHFTDLHLKGPKQTPRWRTGVMADDLLLKTSAILDVYKEYEPDIVTFGGDFVDTYTTSLWTVNQAVFNLRQMVKPDNPHSFFAAWGQHDLIGHNPASWIGSTASLLSWAALTSDAPYTEFVLSDDGSTPETLHAIGILNYHPEVHQALTDGSLSDKAAEVLVAHAMIVPDPVLWDHALISDLKVGAHLVLTGDYHPGFPHERFTNTNGEDAWVVNPGAIARLSIDDKDRPPLVAIIDMTDDDFHFKYVYLPCRPPDEAFNIEAYNEQTADAEEAGKFAELLSELTRDGVATWEMLFERARESGEFDPETIEEAYQRCQTVQNK